MKIGLEGKLSYINENDIALVKIEEIRAASDNKVFYDIVVMTKKDQLVMSIGSVKSKEEANRVVTEIAERLQSVKIRENSSGYVEGFKDGVEYVLKLMNNKAGN